MNDSNDRDGATSAQPNTPRAAAPNDGASSNDSSAPRAPGEDVFRKPYSIGWEDEADDQAQARKAAALGLEAPISPAQIFERFETVAVSRPHKGPAGAACLLSSPAEEPSSALEFAKQACPDEEPETNGGAAQTASCINAHNGHTCDANTTGRLSGRGARITTAAKPSAMPARKPGAPKLPHASKPNLFPAIFSRSALFRVGGSDDSPIAAPAGAAPVFIKTQGELDMTLLGPWPRMRDKAVWEIALELAKASADFRDPIPVNLSAFAKRMGFKDNGGANLRWIWTSLCRLSHCRIDLNSPASSGPRLVGHLIMSATMTNGRRAIEIDPTLFEALLKEDYQFAIDRSRRAKLSTSLAQWIHDFLTTHSTADRPFTLPYLRELCGYAGAKRRFPADLIKALEELRQEAPGVLASFTMDTSTRSSEDWTVALECGAERKVYEKPKPVAKPIVTVKRTGRGGLAL